MRGESELKNIPTPVVVCVTVAFVAVLGTLAYLASSGADATEVRAFLNLVSNLVTVLLSGGALAYAGAAARQTNGALDSRIEDGVTRALKSRDVGTAPVGGDHVATAAPERGSWPN